MPKRKDENKERDFKVTYENKDGKHDQTVKAEDESKAYDKFREQHDITDHVEDIEPAD
jgi:hypothetical protein